MNQLSFSKKEELKQEYYKVYNNFINGVYKCKNDIIFDEIKAYIEHTLPIISKITKNNIKIGYPFKHSQ